MLKGFQRASRNPVHTGLLVLLLTLAVTAFTLGILMYQSTVTQAQQIEDSYTLLITRKSVANLSVEGSTAKELRSVVLSEDHLASENLGRILVGVTDDMPVSIRTLEPGSPCTLYDDDRCIVMVEVTCEASWLVETPLGVMRHEGQNMQAVTMLDMATVHVENVLSAHPAYRDMPESITVYSFLATKDGTSLFVPGERYVLIARYDPPTFTSYGRDLVEQSPGSLSISSAWLGSNLEVLYIREDEKALAASNGSGQIAVLSLDDTRIPTLQAWVERCNNSLAVFGVDSLDHLVYFHEGVAALAQGRSFSEAEVASGAAVCIVSETFAESNGLTIGDTVSLDLYRAPFVGDDQTRASYKLDRNSACVQQMSAVIIGLYDMDWKDGETNRYGFNINTIFVPRLALCEEGDAYSSFSNLGLTGQQIMDEAHLRGNLPLALETISIIPGQQDRYMDSLAQHGLADQYTLYDGGYSRIAGALNAVKQDGTTLATLCLTVWLALTLISLTTHAIRLRSECRILRLLGTPRRQTGRYALGTILPVVLFSIPAGTASGCLLCNFALSMLRKSTAQTSGAFSTQISIEALLPTPELAAILISAACAAFVMLLLTVLFSRLALPGENLIRQEGE